MSTQTQFLEERRTELDARLSSLDDQRKEHETRIERFQNSLGRLPTEIPGREKTETQRGKKRKASRSRRRGERRAEEARRPGGEGGTRGGGGEGKETPLPSLEELKK